MKVVKITKYIRGITLMKRFIVTLLLTFSCAVSAFDDAHLDAHVHGLVEMTLVAEAAHIEVHITSPLMNLVGFEYAPRTESEKAAIQAMAAHFDSPHKWLQFNGSQCELSNHDINHGKDEHDGHDHHHGHEHGAEHAELEATYRFKCDTADLNSVTVSLQDHFPAIESITLNWVVDTTSGTTTLDHNDRQVYFKQ